MTAVSPMNEGVVNVGLVEGWSADDQPQIRNLAMVRSQCGWRPHSEHMFERYRKTGQPACGNLHAGQGRQRVVAGEVDGDVVHEYSDAIGLEEVLGKALPLLGRKILVSAGHYMPDKASSFFDVNQSSLDALAAGLNCIQGLRQRGIASDLIITINDVTIGDGNDSDDQVKGATLGCKERAEFYQRFVLPTNYVELLHEYRRRCDFDIYVVGENKLSERLTKTKGRLVREGLLQPCEGGYALAFDAGRLLEVAHDGGDTKPSSRVFISAQTGVTGRPKCVRACTLLAALPPRLGYTGFVQFLPVCARNALEGLMIGTQLFRGVPYVSVHATQSCF